MVTRVKTMKVGIFQCAGGGLSLNDKILRLQRYIENEQQDSGFKLDLVLCPELFASGYNVADQLIASAEKKTGPVFEKIAGVARRCDSAIVYGYPEQGDNCIHNSAAFVSASGELLANHRKRLNSPGDYEARYFTTGETGTRLNYAGFKIAILICYEVEFPELVREAAAAGAQLVLVPTALASQWGVVASQVVTTRAFENGVWLAYANHAGHENGIDYLGASNIVAPNGTVAAQAGHEETLVATTIDADSVEQAQQRLPYLRDVQKLALETRAGVPV